MAIAHNSIGAIILGSAAIALGIYAASLENPAQARRGDGGVAGGGTTCSTAPAAIIGNNTFDTTAATASLAVGIGGGCTAHTMFKVNYFTFTPTQTGTHIFTTCGFETWDTRLAIFTACGANLIPVGCNDDSCNFQSQINVSLTLGVTYRLVIGGYGSADGGAGTIAISFDTGGGGGGGGGGSIGQDVIVGAIPDIAKYGSAVVNGQTIMAYAIGTTSCNIGDAQLSWFSGPSSNLHPFIPQNVYRVKTGRLEQIGMGWGKHGFTALQGTLCGACTASSSGTWLGVGCSDPYSAGLNGSQSGLGCRSEVNAATGVFPASPNAGMPGPAATIGRRIQVNGNDLNPALNVGAVYFVEAQYVHPGDAAAGNDNNNASWRSCTIGALSSGAYAMTPTGSTMQQKSAMDAWKTLVPAVTLANIDVASDGRFTAGWNITNNGNGTWRYEYAIQNINSHRSARSFSVPVPAGTTITNVGFKDIDYHSGDPYATTDWTSTTTGGAVTWTGGDYAVSTNSNALRFGTTYNFWFDATQPPTNATGTIGLFRPGTAPTETLALQGPGAPSIPADLNGDGSVSGPDLAMLLSNWGGSGTGDINNDGTVGGPDLAAMLAAWTG